MKRSPRFTEAERNAYRAANAGAVGAKAAMPSGKSGTENWFPHRVLIDRLKVSIWTMECEPQRWLRETPGLSGWYRLERIILIREDKETGTRTTLKNYITFTDEQTAFAFKMRWL